MALKIGNRIAVLRKKKGITQEQLAEALGVSAPAVSKWETDSSYPDITILMPLARVLGTDVNTLLQYQENLTEEEVAEQIGRILELAVKKQEADQAWQELTELLHQYPACNALKFRAVSLLTALEVYILSATEEQKSFWRQQKKKLAQEIYQSKDPVYYKQTISMLAAMALQEEELDQAQKLLGELPEEKLSDFTFLQVSLYLKQGKTDKALETVQKRLFMLAGQVGVCLTVLMEEKLCPDPCKGLDICKIYQSIDEIFGCSGGVADGIFAELYLRVGKKQEALESLSRYVERINGNMLTPNPLLFSPTIKTAGETREFSNEMKQIFLRGLLEDKELAELREMPEFKEIVEKVKENLKDGKEMEM